MSSLNKHVIKQPKPFRWLGFILAIIAITFAIQWYANQNSSLAKQQQIKELSQQQQDLKQQLQDQITQNQQLSDTNADLQFKQTEQQHHLAIQQATDQQLQQQLVELQNKVITLNKELVFYQAITQGNTSSKLQVREFQLSADERVVDSYRYRIVITQGQKISTALTGTVNISIKSKRDNNDESITLKKHTLNLRHVQVIEGQLKIADNIEPETITVTIKQKKKAVTSQTFDWQIENNH
jgi:regulator of replication initiation timing